MLHDILDPQVASNGLIVSFLDGFTGTVAPQHFPTPHLQTLDSFKPKRKTKARLLWVDAAVKRVGLTLQRELVEGKAFDFDGVEIGTVFDGTLCSIFETSLNAEVPVSPFKIFTH